MDAPEFVQLRQKTREDLAEESRVLAHKALGEITRRIGEFEPRDLAILYGVLTDKAQLLAGQATARTEHRELSDELDDHEREALTRILREAVEKVEA
jgi:tetrahydromethanopterin S-methyltransferase subunit G